MILNLNKNETDVLETYLTKKVMRLEESGLHDSRFCLAMNSILDKIYEGCKYDS